MRQDNLSRRRRSGHRTRDGERFVGYWEITGSQAPGRTGNTAGVKGTAGRQARYPEGLIPRQSPWMWLGEILLTLGVVLTLFVVWEVGWTNVQAAREQAQVARALEEAFAGDGDTPGPGERRSYPEDIDPALVPEGAPVAAMHIPRFGPDWEYAVVAGTTQPSLVSGPGFYTGSQAPGRTGNTAVAGHRDGRGAPFHHLDALQVCDAIVIETPGAWLTYRVLPVDGAIGEDYQRQLEDCLPWTVAGHLSRPEYAGLPGRLITSPWDVDVVAPVPGDATIAPEEAELSLLTLTTCHPIWSNAQRLIIHAVLEGREEKADHVPEWQPEVLTQEA